MDILIGSCALKHWFPDFPRTPKDEDYIVQEERKNEIVEGIRKEYFLNPVFKDYKHGIMLPDDLYTLKVSHVVGWDIFWEKNVWDVRWLKEKGCKLNLDLFYKLYAYWNILHGESKRSDLEMNAEKFFDNALTCEYSHDWLHTLLQNPPTYTKVLKEGAEVEVSEEKFEALSWDEKYALVFEEVAIMSWERWGKEYYKRAYKRMLKKFILHHAPIWEAVWIMDNYKELELPRFDYFEIINKQLTPQLQENE